MILKPPFCQLYYSIATLFRTFVSSFSHRRILQEFKSRPDLGVTCKTYYSTSGGVRG